MTKSFLLTVSLLLSLIVFGQPFTSSNLPVIVINTNGQNIQSDLKITADMGIIYKGDGVRNNLSDAYNYYNGKIGIEIRGQSSQGFPMNSYNVELRDDLGDELDTSLFGMPNESDWVLYAPYTDKSLMHNFLAYTLSNEMGQWAAHGRYVEVKIDGDYKGIYVFMEKIKRSKGRLNLSQLEVQDTLGDNLTGGYIFSIDKEPNGWYSSHSVPNSIDGGTRQYSYVYPKIDNIVPKQQAYIKSVVDNFEDVTASEYFQDPVRGLKKYIDYASFVDYFILNEVSRNVDGYRLSAYFHKDKDSKNSKIFAGPAWDYDIAFHNADYCNGSLTSGWALDFNYDCQSYASGAIPFFWYKLAREDSFFQSMLYCHWNKYRGTLLSNQHLDHLVDSIAALTAEARTRHFVRWPILGVYVWPNPQPIPADYAGEINQLKQWLHARMDWLDHNMPQTGKCWDENNQGTLTASVYPNPLSNINTIKIDVKNDQMVYLNIYNSAGRLMHKEQINTYQGENYLYNFKIGTWPCGLYYFRFMNNKGEIVTKKTIKIN